MAEKEFEENDEPAKFVIIGGDIVETAPYVVGTLENIPMPWEV